MRRLFLTLLFAAVLAPVALAAPRAAGDGTLSGKNINGAVAVSGHGVIWGQIDSGTLTISPGFDLSDPPVIKASGAVGKSPLGNPLTLVYAGSHIHFQVTGSYRLSIVNGTNIDFSAVGSGRARLDGADKADDTGDYAVGDDAWQSVPYTSTSVVFPQLTTSP